LLAAHTADTSAIAQEPLCSVRKGLELNNDVEHNAILIDGAPELVLHALDPNALISWSRPAATKAIGGRAAEFLTRGSRRFVRNDDATASQESAWAAASSRQPQPPVDRLPGPITVALQ
jgi:hypothetical protein